MGFLQWLWQRSEIYAKIIMVYVVVIAVMGTLAVTYESLLLYRITQGIGLSYFIWMFGYELVYKALKDKYNDYKREQDELFNNIKNPK